MLRTITIIISFYSICIFGIISDVNKPEKMVDKRDGQIYKIVKIGNQIWMAENLRYGKMVSMENQIDNNIIETSSYDNDTNNLKIYGGLYTWDEAMQYGNSKDVQGVASDGEHIPSADEWQQLIEYLGKTSEWKGCKYY